MSNIQNFEEMQKAFLEMQKLLEKIQQNSNNVSKTNLILCGLLVCALGGLIAMGFVLYEKQKSGYETSLALKDLRLAIKDLKK